MALTPEQKVAIGMCRMAKCSNPIVPPSKTCEPCKKAWTAYMKEVRAGRPRLKLKRQYTRSQGLRTRSFEPFTFPV